MTTLEKKQQMIREGQLALFHELQNTLAEVSGEMLGNKTWDTDIVDGMLEDLATEIKDHFGQEASRPHTPQQLKLSAPNSRPPSLMTSSPSDRRAFPWATPSRFTTPTGFEPTK